MTGRKVGPVKVYVMDRIGGESQSADARLYVRRDAMGNQHITAVLNEESSAVSLMLSKQAALELYLILREQARESRDKDARKAAVRYDH